MEQLFWQLLHRVLGERKALEIEMTLYAFCNFLELFAEAMECRTKHALYRCVHCQSAHSVTAKFCPQCGKRIPPMKEREQQMIEPHPAWDRFWRLHREGVGS